MRVDEMMKKRILAVLGAAAAAIALLAVLAGCDTFFSPGDSAEYDTWYYTAEGYEGDDQHGFKPTDMCILGGITDNAEWTIDKDVGSKWRSPTYRRRKGLAHLDIGFRAYFLDLHEQFFGRIDMRIVVNGEVVASGGAGATNTNNGMAGWISYVLGDPADCSVTYKANWCTGGHAPKDDEIYHEGDLVTIKANEGGLEKIGWTLVGWNTSQDGGGQSWKPGDIGTMPDDNVVLYAEWERAVTP
jgi:uncharacterized repeat protein (TIGR02543 family)